MTKTLAKMEPRKRCLIWHRWRLVKDTGMTRYHQCADCGARIVQQEDGAGYQPFNMRWVIGLEDSFAVFGAELNQRIEMKTLTITKPHLEAALLRWVQDAREGKTLTNDEAATLSAEENAALSAEHLWNDLSLHLQTKAPNA